jgi:hypothetical protein
MNKPILLIVKVFFLSLGLLSCGGSGKSLSTSSEQKKDTVKHVQLPSSFLYKFYLEAFGTFESPHDKFWIDTTGQMSFDYDQHMQSGQWKKLRGMAFLEVKDEDTLLTFIKDKTLFDIEEADVTPQCPTGDQYVLSIWRSDLTKRLSIHTNFCAAEYNLLTGPQRKLFPKFLAFLSRLRVRYRPGIMDPAAEPKNIVPEKTKR